MRGAMRGVHEMRGVQEMRGARGRFWRVGQAGRLEGRDGAYGGVRAGSRTMLAAAFVSAQREHGPGQAGASVWGTWAAMAATGGKDGDVILWNAREAQAVRAVRRGKSGGGGRERFTALLADAVDAVGGSRLA